MTPQLIALLCGECQQVIIDILLILSPDTQVHQLNPPFECPLQRQQLLHPAFRRGQGIRQIYNRARAGFWPDKGDRPGIVQRDCPWQ